jgi:hypothetical protein
LAPFAARPTVCPASFAVLPTAFDASFAVLSTVFLAEATGFELGLRVVPFGFRDRLCDFDFVLVEARDAVEFFDFLDPDDRLAPVLVFV